MAKTAVHITTRRIKETITDINDFLLGCYSRKIIIQKGDRTINYSIVDNIGAFSDTIPPVNGVLYISTNYLDSIYGDNCYYDIRKEQFSDPEKYPLTHYFYDKVSKRDLSQFDYDKVR